MGIKVSTIVPQVRLLTRVGGTIAASNMRHSVSPLGHMVPCKLLESVLHVASKIGPLRIDANSLSDMQRGEGSKTALLRKEAGTVGF